LRRRHGLHSTQLGQQKPFKRKLTPDSEITVFF
jgi:hypothetical protein